MRFRKQVCNLKWDETSYCLKKKTLLLFFVNHLMHLMLIFIFNLFFSSTNHFASLLLQLYMKWISHPIKRLIFCLFPSYLFVEYEIKIWNLNYLIFLNFTIFSRLSTTQPWICIKYLALALKQLYSQFPILITSL